MQHVKRYRPHGFGPASSLFFASLFLGSAALFGSLALLLAGSSAVRAETLCFPHCDYTHYYGPYDFSYKEPGLFAYPNCGLEGDCAPHLAYTTGILRPMLTGRITVRLPRAMPPRRP